MAVAELVASLFAAAGRDYGETHLEVYARALADVPDDVGAEARDALVREVSWDRPPSVRLVLDAVNSALRHRQELVPALPEAAGEPVTQAEALAWVRKIREGYGQSGLVDVLEDAAMRQPNR